ncbi:MAG: TerB family tellurite resistance protein [Nannocystaceae bacterium]|nr:TerB family tellurite resistance protein [bacterium]
MPLSPEQEWTLVACGLVAHADGVLDAAELEQVLWMLDERLDGDDSAAWVERLGSEDALRTHAKGLQLPPPLFSEDILSKAWRMALTDGRGTDREAQVHDELAGMLGEDADAAARWRQAWSTQAEARAELIAGFAAHIAQADGQVSDAERESFDALLGRLPLAEGTTEAMKNLIDEPPEMMMLIGGFAGLAPEERRIAMLELVPVVTADGRDAVARKAFIDLAGAIAIDPAEAQRMLER